jgi:hypothetical protein
VNVSGNVYGSSGVGVNRKNGYTSAIVSACMNVEEGTYEHWVQNVKY